MQIELQRVAPTFIESEKIAASHIWNEQLVFQPGEKIQVVAPSGSGKTSFIHFLYGMRKDYSGTVSYNNQDIKTFNAETFAIYRQQHISIVFQDLRLFAEQTVMQNLEIKRQLNPYHSQSKIEAMAKQLGIESKLNKPCKTCSYGEQQRIAIIRALQQPFEYLLLDEPLSHLDQVNREKVMDLIAEEVSLRQAAVILADLKPTDYFKADKTINL
jgi:putative ABC transport system ATP-binding protein